MKEISIEKRKINKLRVFDFDGTLINTPTPELGKIIYKEKTGKAWPYKGFWSKSQSLNMDIFDMPLIMETYEIYINELKDDNSLMVMMTGRLKKLSNEVEKILNYNNLIFDQYVYNMGGDTLSSKLKSLNNILVDYPNISDVMLTDDRIAHVDSFKEWGLSLLENGRLKNFQFNLIEGYSNH